MTERHELTRADRSFQQEITAHSGDRNLVYKTVNGEPLRISLYYPADYRPDDRQYPLFAFIHGGGWQGRRIFDDQACWSGDYLGYLARYYAGKGYLCASIDYRMMKNNGQTPEYELIDLYEDCMDAVGYLRVHADDLGVNLNDTVLLGESAGGYLAAAVLTLSVQNGGLFKKAVLVNAITDLSDPRWGSRIAGQSAHHLLAGRSMDEKAALLSPVCHIHSGLCPVLLLHGEEDDVVFPFHSQKFHDLSCACGNKAHVDYLAHTNHAFLLAEYMLEKNRTLDAACLAIQCIDRWLEKK